MLRQLQKYAVTCGGGYNHRLSLDSSILIKDNHINYIDTHSEEESNERLICNLINNFYENNLCVFVDFSLELAWHTTRMYLGEMTSSAEELANFRKDRKQLSFKCYLLYSDDRCPEEELFTKNFTFDSLPHKGVLIGFLPNEFKDIVLNDWSDFIEKGILSENQIMNFKIQDLKSYFVFFYHILKI